MGEAVENVGGTLENEIVELRDNTDKLQESLESELSELQDNTDKLQESLERDISRLQDNTDELKMSQSVLCGYQDAHSSGSVITYDKVYEEVNHVGSSLSSYSGKFTAGKTGTYLVSLSAYYGYTRDDGILYVYLRTSSGKYQDNYEDRFALQQGVGTSDLYTPLSAARCKFARR